jgi:GDP-L-fucose synthase
MTKNIFITGGSGFLGKNLIEALKQRGYQIVAPTSKECNLLQDKSLNPWQEEKFDMIFHLAAWTQAGDFCLKYPGNQWFNNQRLNTNILEFWSNFQTQAKLITIGTSCSYSPDFPLIEENYLQGQPIESLYTYAMTKRMLWVGQKALEKQFGLKHLTLVPSTLYGMDYHTDGRQLHFIFDLIRKILHGKLCNAPVILWGDGYQRRELIHVSDFVSTLLNLTDTSCNDIINIGAGQDFSIKEFAHEICIHVGFDANKIQYDTSKYVGAKSKCLNIDKLKSKIPAFNPRPIQKGLKEVIEWMQVKDVFFNSI